MNVRFIERGYVKMPELKHVRLRGKQVHVGETVVYRPTGAVVSISRITYHDRSGNTRVYFNVPQNAESQLSANTGTLVSAERWDFTPI
jgi:hypothetical protein